jgi:hypothetical protein
MVGRSFSRGSRNPVKRTGANRPRQAARAASLLAAACFASHAGAAAPSNTENFDTSPADWQNLGSATYGFATSNNTGQASPGGEAGGLFDRNFIAKGYGDVHLGGKLTPAMPLTASGEFFLGGNMSNTDTSAYIGYFAQNTIGKIGDTNDPNEGGHDRFGLFLLHNNATGNPPDGTNFRFRVRMYNGNTLRRDGNTVTLPLGDNKFKYDFSWNPDTLQFTGRVLNVDGVTVLGTSTLQLNPGENVWAVDTYGLTHGTGSQTDPQPTRTYELYVDAVKYTTIVPGPKTFQSFDSSPSNWVKIQNPTWGFSNTDNTGQESPAGEAGGTIFRDDKGRAYADISIGQITQAMPFGAAGEFSLTNPQDANTEILIGHFAQAEVDGATQDPAPNKAGLFIQDDGSNFRFLTRMYTDTGARLDSPTVSLPTGQYKFEYLWDPDTLTLSARMLDPDGVTVRGTTSQTVPAGTTFTFDAFGLIEGFTGAANPTPQTYDLFVDALTYTTGVVPSGSEWNVNDNGNWTDGGNWSGGVPNGAGSLATFGAIITGPKTVTLDAAQTVGGIIFNNANSYTIAGSNTLTIDASSGNGSLKVLAGSHTIAAPIVLADDTTVEVAAGQTLSVQHLRGAGLNVSTGTLRITAGGSPNSSGGTSKVTSLAIASGAALDLTNNSAIVDYTGSVGTLVDDTRQHLLAGRLTSSSATTTRGLGYADNATLDAVKASFGGQSVDASSLLIKYTYFGDTDLDGDVDVGDLGKLATAWQTANTWANGDFDYNNSVDVNDLGLLATNWQQGVGSPLGPSLSEALASLGLPSAAVPEPTTMGLLLVAGLTGHRRHRRC